MRLLLWGEVLPVLHLRGASGVWVPVLARLGTLSGCAGLDAVLPPHTWSTAHVHRHGQDHSVENEEMCREEALALPLEAPQTSPQSLLLGFILSLSLLGLYWGLLWSDLEEEKMSRLHVNSEEGGRLVVGWLMKCLMWLFLRDAFIRLEVLMAFETGQLWSVLSVHHSRRDLSCKNRGRLRSR